MLSVEKSQRVNIEKESGGATLFVVGMGWDTAADLDASAVLCKQQAGGDATCVGTPGVIYFGQKDSQHGGVHHMGDALSGLGNDTDADDEQIVIDTSKLAADGADQVDLWVTIFKPGSLTFGAVKDAYVRIYPATRDAAGAPVLGAPILKYDLTEDYSTSTAVQFGALYLKDGEWRFQAIGTGQKAEIGDIINSYIPGAA